MRRLKYFFTVAEGEKVTEKCFRRILLSSALGILLCMTCLISTTWALFTTTLVSEGNSIEVGTFTPHVQVSGDAVEQASAENVYTYQLPTQRIYTVTIANAGTAKGYCQVDILKTTEEGTAVEAAFTTGTLFAGAEGQTGMSVSFAVEVNETEKYSLKVTPHWGADPYTYTEVNNVLYTAGTEQPNQEDDTQTGDGDDTQTGDGDDTQTDDGDDTQTDDGDDTQTGDGDDTQTGDGDDTQTGDGDDTQTGDGDDTQTGDGDDTQTGDGDDTQTGDGDDTQTGDGDDTQTGDGDDAQSGGGDVSQPGDEGAEGTDN